jgi:hypothetical protein
VDHVTAEDIAESNDEQLAQIAKYVRTLALGVLVVAGLMALSWLWISGRAQWSASDRGGGGFSFSTAESGVSFANRLDLVATTFGYLAQAALAATVGAVAYLWSSKQLAAQGHSLFGAQVGDPVPDVDEDDQHLAH